MARDLVINGETLVTTKFGAHIGPGFSNRAGALTNLSELGLASEGIHITPRFVHRDMLVDDYGPEVSADVMWFLADCNISMTLIHWDPSILDFCLSESMGGTMPGSSPGLFNFAGVMAPAGTPLGGFVPYLLSGYHFTSLNLLSPQLAFPYHFPAAYLTGPPMDLPLGTSASAVRLNWRAIPYFVPLTVQATVGLAASESTSEFPSRQDGAPASFSQTNANPVVVVNPAGEIVSSGVILWNHLPDVI